MGHNAEEQLAQGVNQRVVKSRERLKDLPLMTIERLSTHLLSELGEPNNQIEQESLDALTSGDYDSAKRDTGD